MHDIENLEAEENISTVAKIKRQPSSLKRGAEKGVDETAHYPGDAAEEHDGQLGAPEGGAAGGEGRRGEGDPGEVGGADGQAARQAEHEAGRGYSAVRAPRDSPQT